MTPRRYEQKLRADAAEETRRRILDAVYQRLTEAPSEPVSLDRIARMAGVARSTVYLVFGSRAGLFHALGRDLAESAGYAELIEAVSHPDPLEHMRGGIRAGVGMFAARRDVYRAIYSMAPFEPDAVGTSVKATEDERARGMARLAKRLADHDLLRPGLSEKDAAHTLWVLTSFEAFDLLYTGRGLSTKKTSDLLAAAAEAAVTA